MRIRNIDQLVAFSVQQNVPARQIDIVNQSPQGILESRDNEAAVNEMSVAHPRRSPARYRGRNVRSAGNPRTGAQACGQKGTALAGAEKQVLTRMRVKCPVACPGPLAVQSDIRTPPRTHFADVRIMGPLAKCSCSWSFSI
jgi:hypothetical protein